MLVDVPSFGNIWILVLYWLCISSIMVNSVLVQA